MHQYLLDKQETLFRKIMNTPAMIAARQAAVSHLKGVPVKSPAAAMVANNAYHLSGPAAIGAAH
ncbi:hypothetical protein [Rhizobium sp. BK376]|uniref:hypothetical protein n=1 Tax=Rhizobium sp. BK376 TaxID=2512149 RepID=UPI0010501BE2|nr:hypothetical protein [Rhizobium sp. BK376]TCR85513.1 hypothetical protein EV561_107291 [Rhizobium sp. BK376]